MEILFAIVGGWFLAAVLLGMFVGAVIKASDRAERVCQRLLLDSGYRPYDWLDEDDFELQEAG